MCMNKSIMSPEFMSGALRKTNKLTVPPKPPAAVTARFARQQKITHPPPRNGISLRPCNAGPLSGMRAKQ